MKGTRGSTTESASESAKKQISRIAIRARGRGVAVPAGRRRSRSVAGMPRAARGGAAAVAAKQNKQGEMIGLVSRVRVSRLGGKPALGAHALDTFLKIVGWLSICPRVLSVVWGSVEVSNGPVGVGFGVRLKASCPPRL